MTAGRNIQNSLHVSLTAVRR